MKISVLIPSFNNPDVFNKCLHSLTEQTIAPFEVVVVDNAPNDVKTATIVHQFPQRLSVHYYKEPRLGRAFARNALLDKSKGDILAFLDHDCLAEKTWIEEIGKTFSRPHIIGMLGRSENALPQNPSAVAEQCWYLYWRMKHYHDLDRKQSITNGNIFDFKNAAFRRSVIDSLRFSDVLEEDIVFGHHLLKSTLQGGQIIYNPKAIVFHFNSKSLSAMVKRRFSFGVGRAKLLEEFPDFPQEDKQRVPLDRWLRACRIETKNLKSVGKLLFLLCLALYQPSWKFGMWSHHFRRHVWTNST